MRIKRRTGIVLWVCAAVLGMALHAPIASAVSTIYRNAIIFGTGASTCSGALGQSCTGLNVTYWNSGDLRPHVHSANGTEYAIPQTAVALSGGYATTASEGTPLTQRVTINMSGSGVSCVDNSISSRTDCTFTAPGTYNVKDYGAKADGSDDTTAIQAAINAAPAGSVVYFPKGTYIHTTLTVSTASLILRGEGTLKKKASVDGVALSIQASNVSVRDLILDGTNTQPTSSFVNDMIRIGTIGVSGVTRTTIRNVTINGGKGNGIASYRSSEGQFINNKVYSVHDNGIFIADVGSDSNLVEGNLVDTTTTQNCIFLTASHDSSVTTDYIYGNVVRGNVALNGGDTGIETGIHTIGTVIDGNSVRGSVNPGILLRDCTDVTVIGNLVEMGSASAAASSGIAVVFQNETETWDYASTIEDNTIRAGYGRSGIYIGGSGVTVDGNHIKDVVTAAGASGSGTTMRGITLGPGTGFNDVTIRGNDIANMYIGIDGNYGAGSVTMNNVRIVGNIIHGVQIAVNVFNWTTTANCVLAGNQISKVNTKAFSLASMAGGGTFIWQDNPVNPAGYSTVGTTGDAPPATVTQSLVDLVSAQTIAGVKTFSSGPVAPTIGPSGAQQHTLPAVASDTVVLLAASQTLTNKTLTNQTINGHAITSGSAPGIATSGPTQLGTGPGVAISGNDTAGNLTITPGTSPAVFVAGTSVTLATVTFNGAFGSAPKNVYLFPANAAAAKTMGSINIYCVQSSIATNTFTVDAVSASGPALVGSAAYKFYYLVLG